MASRIPAGSPYAVSKPKPRKPKPSTGGHPSQGAPTTGGRGTKKNPFVPYKPRTRSSPAAQAITEHYNDPAFVPSPTGRARPSHGKSVGKAVERTARKERKRIAAKKQRSRSRKRASRQRSQQLQALRALVEPFKLDKLDTDTHVGPINVESIADTLNDTAKRQVARLPLVAGLNAAERVRPEKLTRELEGRGEISKLAEKLKKGPLSDSNISRQGVFHGAVARDALDIATQAVPSTYLTVAGITEAAQGDPKRIKKLWKDYKETSAIPAAVEGNFEEAWKRASGHPLSTALEVSGAKAVVGRSGGATMRSGALGSKARRAASTKRNDLRLYPKDIEGGPREGRSYSRDVINKALQKTGEKIQRKRGRDPDVDYGRRSLHLDDETPIRRRLLRQVDTDLFAGEGIRRRRREDAVRETVKVAPPEGEPIARALARSDLKPHHSPAVQLVAEGVVRSKRTFKSDLKRELKRLETVYPKAQDLSKAAARANRTQRKQIERILSDKSVDVDAIFGAARDFTRAEEGRQTRLREQGQYVDTEHAKRFYPYLQTHHKLGRKGEEAATAKQERARADREVKRQAKRVLGKEPPRSESAALKRMEAIDQFDEALAGRRALRDLPDDPDVLSVAARALERRQRRGKATPVKPAFISQKRMKTSSAMFVPTMRGTSPATPGGRARTGKGYEVGARELGGEPMLRQAAQSEGLATAVENFHVLSKKYGVSGRSDGGYARNWNDAVRLGRELTEDPDGNLKPGHVPLKPVNVAPFRTFGDKLSRIQERSRPGANIDAEVSDAFAEAVRSAFEKPDNGKGKFVLMPEDVIARIQEHQFTRTKGEKALESLSNMFTSVVLTTSSPSTWLLGNATDLGVRSVLAGLRPLDVARGHRTIKAAKAIDPRRGEELEQTLTGGGLYHAGSRARVHRPTRIGQSKVARVPAAPWRAWRDGVFAVERVIEELPQFGALGKAMRQDTQLQGSVKGLLKLTDEQVNHFADNLVTDRALEARIQKGVEDVVGRWGKVSPTMRKYLAGVAPFAQWLGAALRYTYVTLPTHHPIKVGIVAAMYEMTEKERVKLGLTLKGDPADRVLDHLQGSIPLGGQGTKDGVSTGGLLRTSRLTSFGTAGSFPSNTGEFLFPQLKGAVFALAGVAWTGDELVYPDGHPKEGQPVPRELREKIALGLLMEGFLPFAGAGRRIFQEQGRPSDPTSSILTPETRKKWNKKRKKHVEQEGSITDALVDWLNPVGKSRRLTEGDIQIFEDAKKRGEVFEELRNRPSKPKDPRSEFEEFKNKKTEGVREEFEDYRKKSKSDARSDFEAYVGGR